MQQTQRKHKPEVKEFKVYQTEIGTPDVAVDSSHFGIKTTSEGSPFMKLLPMPTRPSTNWQQDPVQQFTFEESHL